MIVTLCPSCGNSAHLFEPTHPEAAFEIRCVDCGSTFEDAPQSTEQIGGNQMILAEKRKIALGAARSQIRKLGIDFTLNNAEVVLDEMARTKPSLIASQWWLTASDYQYKLFRREWNRMCLD